MPNTTCQVKGCEAPPDDCWKEPFEPIRDVCNTHLGFLKQGFLFAFDDDPTASICRHCLQPVYLDADADRWMHYDSMGCNHPEPEQ